MDNNDSNIKSQQTGGLKLMTVFIAVLALHVVVIGGFTVYHLMSGGSTDTDTATITDKSHKGTDSSTPDATASDKSTTTAAPTEVASIPATAPVTPASAPAPTGDTVSPNVASATTPTIVNTPAQLATATATPATVPAPISTPALTLAQPNPAPATVATPTTQTPSGPIAPALLPPSEPAPAIAPAPAPMAPVVAPAASSLAAGPVHMPPANKDASRVTHAKEPKVHEQVYTVKITDSYKKIAKAHHITVAQLKEANGIKNDTLHTGQKLFIPSMTKSELAESTLSSSPTVLNATAAPMTTGLSSSTTSATTTTAGGHRLYTIEKGDTLTKIAHKFKTTPSALLAANSDLDPTKLKIGKKLRIPSKEARSASNSVPVNAVPANRIPVAPIAQPAQVQQATSVPSAPAKGELTSFSL